MTHTNSPVLVVSRPAGQKPLVISGCEWTLKTFLERDAYLDYDWHASYSRPIQHQISWDHIDAINGPMRARSSRAAWLEFVGKPLPALTGIRPDLDLIDSPDSEVDEGWNSLSRLTQQIAKNNGITEMAVSKVAYLLRPQFVAIADEYVRNLLGIYRTTPAETMRSVQRAVRQLGKNNRDLLTHLEQQIKTMRPLQPKHGNYAGKAVPLRVSRLRILDILLWTHVAIHGQQPHPQWSAWYQVEVLGMNEPLRQPVTSQQGPMKPLSAVTKRPGKWPPLVETIVRRLDNESVVTMSVDDIVRETGTADQAVRTRGFWRSNQRGDRDYALFTGAGLDLDFHPDVHGQLVERVTFRRRQ